MSGAVVNFNHNMSEFMKDRIFVRYVEHQGADGERYLCYSRGDGYLLPFDVEKLPNVVATMAYLSDDGRALRGVRLSEYLESEGYDPYRDYGRPEPSETPPRTVVDGNIAAFLETQRDVLCVMYDGRVVDPKWKSKFPVRLHRYGWNETSGVGELGIGDVLTSEPEVLKKGPGSKYVYSKRIGDLADFLKERGYDPNVDYGTLGKFEPGPNAKAYNLGEGWWELWAKGVVNEVGCDLDEAKRFVAWLRSVERDDDVKGKRYAFSFEKTNGSSFRIRFEDRQLSERDREDVEYSVEYLFRKWRRRKNEQKSED